jgi:hypothetical protein
MTFFKRLRNSRDNAIRQSAESTVVRNGGLMATRSDRVRNRLKTWREAASTRRQERAEIVSHRKWIFISLAVIAVTALAFYCIIKFGGFL